MKKPAAKAPAKPAAKAPAKPVAKAPAKPAAKAPAKPVAKGPAKPDLKKTVDNAAFVSGEKPELAGKGKLAKIKENKFQNIATINAHKEEWILSLLILKDGRFITTSEDNTMKLWDEKESDKKPLMVFEGHSSAVTNVIAFTQGKIISCSRDKTMRVWTITTGKEVNVIESEEPHTCMCQLTDSEIAAAGGENVIRVFDLSKEDVSESAYTLEGHTDLVNDLCYLDDKHIASCSNDCKVMIWDFTKRQKLSEFPGHKNGIVKIKLLQDGTLASVGNDDVVNIWNWKGLKCTMTIDLKHGHLLDLAQLMDGRLAITTSEYSFFVYNMDKKSIDKEVTGHEECINAIGVRANGEIITCDREGLVKIWN